MHATRSPASAATARNLAELRNFSSICAEAPRGIFAAAVILCGTIAMKLRLKFNLMLVAVFALALTAAGILSYRQLNENAEHEVLSNAGVLMESLLSARTWAVVEVGPNLREIDEGEEYLMMGIPPYASKKVMAGIQKRYPDYKYRELAINPMNLKEHYPEDWERQMINLFRIDPNLKEQWGYRHTADGKFLYLARPIEIDRNGCLGCHSTPDKSPKEIVEMYGKDAGYGWKLNEIVGMQMVMVPTSVPEQNAERMFVTFMSTIGSVFFLLFLLINWMLESLVVRPINRMADAADEISKGNLKVPEFNEEGKDEVAHLASSFNRMKRSLEKAMALFYSKSE
jgi:HAMP domain-containing protein